MSDRKITIEYNDKIVRQFLLASVLWGAGQKFFAGIGQTSPVNARLDSAEASFSLASSNGEAEPHMNPLIAAILMPVNSLITLTLVTGGMRGAFAK